MRAKAKRVVILGATGSIGRSAVEVVRTTGALGISYTDVICGILEVE